MWNAQISTLPRRWFRRALNDDCLWWQNPVRQIISGVHVCGSEPPLVLFLASQLGREWHESADFLIDLQMIHITFSSPCPHPHSLSTHRHLLVRLQTSFKKYYRVVYLLLIYLDEIIWFDFIIIILFLFYLLSRVTMEEAELLKERLQAITVI